MAQFDVTTANLVAAVKQLKDKLLPVLETTSTTVNLGNSTHAVNTTGKFKGKQVFNETTGILVVAAGPAATDVWKNAGTGVTAHTPNIPLG